MLQIVLVVMTLSAGDDQPKPHVIPFQDIASCNAASAQLSETIVRDFENLGLKWASVACAIRLNADPA